MQVMVVVGWVGITRCIQIMYKRSGVLIKARTCICINKLKSGLRMNNLTYVKKWEYMNVKKLLKMFHSIFKGNF